MRIPAHTYAHEHEHAQKQVCDKLSEADGHMRSGNMRMMAGDARVTVASVEALALTEQLQVMYKYVCICMCVYAYIYIYIHTY